MNDASNDRLENPDEIIGLAPADATDPLLEAFKKDVDRTLLIANLRKTVDQRARQMQSFLRARDEVRGTAWRQKVRGQTS